MSASPSENTLYTDPPDMETVTSVKDRIEHYAIELFGLKGFASTSVREIVEAAGVTKPTLYYYFKDKDDLYEQLIVGTLDRFYTELERSIEKPGSLEEKLCEIVLTHFKYIAEKPLVVRFMFRALFGFGAQTPVIDFSALTQRNSHLILRALTDAIATEGFPSEAASEFSVTAFIGQINIYMLRFVVGFQDDLSPKLAELIVKVYLEGVKSQKA